MEKKYSIKIYLNELPNDENQTEGKIQPRMSTQGKMELWKWFVNAAALTSEGLIFLRTDV